MKYKTTKSEITYKVEFWNVHNEIESVTCASQESAQYCAIGLNECDDNRDIRVVVSQYYPLSAFARRS